MQAQECLAFVVPAWDIVLSEATWDVYLCSIRKDVTVCLIDAGGNGCWEVLGCRVDIVGEVSPSWPSKSSTSAPVFPQSAGPMMVFDQRPSVLGSGGGESIQDAVYRKWLLPDGFGKGQVRVGFGILASGDERMGPLWVVEEHCIS